MNNGDPRTFAGWSVRRRLLASGILTFHLLAIFCAPWHSPPPASYLSEVVNRFFAPYQGLAFLDHGYRFFAPDPGPSHIVRYELVTSDGRTRAGSLPDTQAHSPRLLYHRFFMATETLFNVWTRIETPPAEAKLSAEERKALEQPRQMVQAIAQGIAQQLLRETNGKRVHLYLVEHLIPLPEDVAANKRLNDPTLYRDLADLGEFEYVP